MNKRVGEGVTSNMYLRMEAERDKVPLVLKEDFIPSYVVTLLREKLGGLDNFCTEWSGGGGVGKGGWTKASDETGEKWTEDSFLEGYADLEGSLLIGDDPTIVYVNQVLSFGVDVMQVFGVDRRKFAKCFLSEVKYPNLELLWLLDCCYNLISLSSYLMQVNQPSRIQYFQQQFKLLCTSQLHFEKDVSERSVNVLKHSLQTLISCSQCNPKNNENIAKLKDIAKGTLFQLMKVLVTDQSVPHNNHSMLKELFKEAQVPNLTKKRCFGELLKYILTCQTFSESSLGDIANVIRYQERFSSTSYLVESQSLGDIINLMIGDRVDAACLIDIITQSIRSPVRNWDKILRVITEWINRSEYEATSAMKEIVKDLMRLGLSCKDEEKVSLAFVFARHCSLVAPKIFSRYEKWYSHMFESEIYSPARDPESFEFLAKLLSQWIPFEPSCFLQVQATFWPYIPTGCRSLWSDYVSVAKVRVAEYNEVESAMEFEPNSNNPVQYDVEMTIKAYENTRTVPQSVAHMWMFRKQYYLEQFLPVLLKKPLGSVLSDARLRLIEVLNKEGKIPTELYIAFRNSRDTR